MGLLSRIFGRTETRSAPDYLPQSFGMFGGGSYNDTGVSITESNALICSAVWACVSIIGQTISTLPMHVIRRSDGEKLYDHPLHRALSISPNPFMTPAVFREALMTNALLWGGAGAAVARDGAGHVEALYPLRASDVRPVRRAGSLIYEARVGSNLYELTPDQIVYLLGWSMDGVTPMSPVRSGTQAIALDVAMGRYAAKAFGGGNIGGILQMPKMSDDAMNAFIESWRKNYIGIDNAFRVAALPDPMKFVPTTMNPETAQMTEARKNQVLEVARYYKVPPHMLGLLDKGSSFSSVEQANMVFAQQTIAPWCVKLEQELGSKGLLESERGDLEVRFNLDGLLRASTTERYTAFQTGRQGGWLSINDIRRKESLPPIEGGDGYLEPLNMTPVGKAGAVPGPKPEPTSGQPGANPTAKDGTVEAGVSTDQTLNGAQIAAAIDVLDKLARKALVDFAAVELLVAVGISRDKAEQIVTKTKAAPPPPAPAPDPTATRALLSAIVKRFVTKEAKATQRAAAKRDGDQLRTWAATFYAEHEQLVVDALTPVLRAAGLMLDAAKLAKRHCDGGVRLVESGVKQKLEAGELVEDIEGRTADLVDYILNEGKEDHAAAA